MQSTERGSSRTQNLPPYKYFTTTVALITAQSEGRRPNVMACEWVMNVCREPLRIMVVIKKEDLTHELIWASGEFGVNLCSEGQSALSYLAGNTTGESYNKLEDPLFTHLTYRAGSIQAPMLRECVLNAECVVEEKIDIDKYTAFIGLACEVSTNAELRPLLYCQGKYVRLGDWIPKPSPLTI